MHAASGARVLRSFPRLGVQVLELPGAVDIRERIESYRASGTVDYAEPDYEVHVSTTPNDPQYLNGVLWALNNTGQNGGVFDADMDAPEAWNMRTQATNVIVAVIDTGIRYTHEDIAANIWTNPAEIPGNGIDDDGDSFVDDVHGINAITHTGNPNDDHGHGTHVAGIIGAVGNNGIGVVGVAWRVQLMACKFISSSGSGYVSDAITCIDFARTHGANVMNNSWGGTGYSQALKDAIDDAGAAGIIFVAAAGNSSINNDAIPFYPAAYTSDNMVTVAATTRTDALAYFSNYGQRSVDVGAPGYDITSTWYTSDSAYTSLSGTSMATPEASGVIAMLKAQFPGENYHQLFNRLYSSVDSLNALGSKCRTGGRVNLAKALGSTSSQPGNDNFTNRLLVSGSAVSIEGINVDATKEPGEPDHADNAGGKSIWWSWSPDMTGVATLTTAGSTFNTLLAVYTGSNVTALTSIASNTAGANSSATFEALAGTFYPIAIDGLNGESGSVVLNVTLHARPANDNFTNRIAITGSVATVTGSNPLATMEWGEPLHAGQSGGKSVWWSWTSFVSGPATFTTAGSDFNTLLAVYTGTDLSNLTAVASNDDAPGGGTTTSQVDFLATAGTTYQIAVDGYHGAAGNVVLNTPPLNDHFTNRIALAGDNATAVGFNVLASREPGEPSHAGNAGGKSLWWNWTAPASGLASVTTIGSTFDTLLAVYLGSGVNGLTLVAANDNDPYGNFTSLLSFSAVAGTTYQIAVDGENSASGKVMLQVMMGSRYVVTEVSPPAGYHNTGAYSMNNSGTVAGIFMTDAPSYTPHACIWTSSGGVQQLMTGDTESQANDINDFNQVVGRLGKPGYSSIAFIWQNGVVHELGGLGSPPWSEAYSIDNAGRVLGWSYVNGTFHAFLWQDGIVKDLGGVGTDRSYARGLNGPNFICGWGSDVNANGQWPLLWQNGVITNLPMPVGATEGVALAMNGLSQIVGHYNGGSVFHSLLWQDGTMTDIGGFAGSYGTSRAEAINNLGQVVGSDGNYNHALLWQSGTWTNLESLIPAGSGWTSLFMAYKINDHGQIAGAGLRNGNTRGYVMTPLTPVTPQAIILSPTNQQVFYASQDIPFTFWLVPDATDVTRMDVFQGTSVIGTATNAPFPIVWRNASAGQYSLSARTTISSGATATSKTVSISVIPQPKINFAIGTNYSPPRFVVSWPTSALGFTLEAATNLQPPVVWTPLTGTVQVINGTNTATIGLTNNSRFFRLRQPL